MQPIDAGSQTMPGALIVQEQRAQTRGLVRTFTALRHRNYRLFFFGQMISQIGTWMQTTAQAWLVLELTHSALLLGLVGVVQFLPVMVFSLFGGVLADRLPKRTLLLVTRQAFVGEMVGREDLTNAIALNSSLVQKQRSLILALDGLRPDVDHEVRNIPAVFLPLTH